MAVTAARQQWRIVYSFQTRMNLFQSVRNSRIASTAEASAQPEPCVFFIDSRSANPSFMQLPVNAAACEFLAEIHKDIIRYWLIDG